MSTDCARFRFVYKMRKKERNGFYFKKNTDRIYRINWIEGPSAYGNLAAGEKNLINPVYPVQKKRKIESIQPSVSYWGGKIQLTCIRAGLLATPEGTANPEP